MKTPLALLFLLLLFTGCSDSSSFRKASNKIQYDLINEVLNQYVFIPYGDDVRAVGYTGCVFQLMPGKEQMDPILAMLNKTEEILSQEDREYMEWQLEQNWNKKINRSLIDSYNITVIKDRDENLEELCNSMLLFISPPLFSQDKQHAVIWQSLEYKDLSAAFLLILEKQKNRWVMISYDTAD